MPITRPPNLEPGSVDFASNANYPAGANPWSGTATQVQPDSSDWAAGVVPSFAWPAQWANWLWGGLTAWIRYLRTIIDVNEEHTYQTAKARSVLLPGLALLGTNWARDGHVYAVTFTNSTSGEMDISKDLRTGEVLTVVSVLGALGANAGTTGIACSVHRYDHSTDTDTSLASGVSALTAGYQPYDISLGAGETIDRTRYSYYLLVLSSDNVAGGTGDQLRGIKLHFNDPGPRNA